ncbi:MAG: hypothetical protein MK116_10450 [Phycisphaerales bacterium]|nr:hypothetical protein [Phycisphaerales bacterium]
MNTQPQNADAAPAERRRSGPQGTAGKFVVFIGSNWVRTLAHLVVGFILAPLLLGSFGVVLFGLYMLIGLFTAAMVMPIRTALQQLFVKTMTEATAEGDERRIAEVFTNVVAMTWMVGFGFMAVGGILAWLAPAIIEFPDHHLINVRVALITESMAIGLLILRTPWLCLFMVEHRVISFNFDVMMLRWLELLAFGLAMIPLGLNTFLAFILFKLVLVAIHCFIRILLGRRLIKAARFRVSLLSRKVARQLAKTGALSTAQPFSSFAFDVIDHYLLNITFGPVFNAIYAVVNALRSYARRFGQEASVGGEAISADMHERGRRDAIVRSLLGIMRLVSGLMLISSGVVALFFGPIVDVWLGSRLSEDPELLAIMSYEEAIDLAWIFVLMLLVGGVLMEVSIAGSRYLYGMGLIGKYSGLLFAAALCKILIGVSLVVLLLSPWELSFLPDKGSAEATLLFPGVTLLCQLLFFGFLFPRRIIKLARIPFGQYLVQVWVRPLGAVSVPLIGGAVFIFFIESWTIWHLALTLIGVGLLFIPMIGWVLLTRNERERLMGILFRVLGRLRGRRSEPDAEPS